MPAKRVAIVVNSRANYGRIKSVLQAIAQRSDLELLLIVGASAMLYRFGSAINVIQRDGFQPAATLHSVVEGDTPGTMAKSTGLAIIELSTVLEQLAPDIVLTVADRYETMATAIAASYMNIPLAHTQGGEVTGSIDESVRHAITKLAHQHFTATERATDFVRRMGEEEDRIFFTGCPAMDIAAAAPKTISKDLLDRYGVGSHIDTSRPFLVVLQHPVTTEYGLGAQQIRETLTAVLKTEMQTAWLWPNIDAGSDQISKELRTFREGNPAAPIHFYRNFSPEDYVAIINTCACLVGNSSSAIREGAFLGIPAVNIGTRQSHREHGANIVHAGYDADDIEQAIRDQVSHGKYPPSMMFGDGTAGEQIAEALATTVPRIKKVLTYVQEPVDPPTSLAAVR